MQFTVQHGMRYLAEIKLSGIETWASDDDIITKLEDAGFSDVTVYTIEDDLRIAAGVWSGKDTKADLPEQIIYVEEAPL